MEFSPCVLDCQPTCSDPEGNSCTGAEDCEGGCQCIEGLVFNGETCILPEQCGCLFNGWRYMVRIQRAKSNETFFMRRIRTQKDNVTLEEIEDDPVYHPIDANLSLKQSYFVKRTIK